MTPLDSLDRLVPISFLPLEEVEWGFCRVLASRAPNKPLSHYL